MATKFLLIALASGSLIGGSPDQSTCEATMPAVAAQTTDTAVVICLPTELTEGELLLLQRQLGVATANDADEPVTLPLPNKTRADAALETLINDEER